MSTSSVSTVIADGSYWKNNATGEIFKVIVGNSIDFAWKYKRFRTNETVTFRIVHTYGDEKIRFYHYTAMLFLNEFTPVEFKGGKFV